MLGGQKFSKIFHRKILSNLFGIISCFFRNVKRFQKFICFLSGQTLRAWASLKYQSYMHITKLNQLPGHFVPTGFWQSREITADMSDVNDERYMRKFYDKGKNYGAKPAKRIHNLLASIELMMCIPRSEMTKGSRSERRLRNSLRQWPIYIKYQFT